MVSSDAQNSSLVVNLNEAEDTENLAKSTNEKRFAKKETNGLGSGGSHSLYYMYKLSR